MNGHLAERSPSDLLADIQKRQASGVLLLRHGPVTRQIFIDAGVMIRFAISTHPSENIALLFRDKGGVTGEQIRQGNDARQEQELLGTTLVRLAFLSREKLSGLTREHIHRVVIGALSMREGTYEFQAGALPFREQLDTALPMPEILLEWARVMPDLAVIKRRFGAAGQKVTLSTRPPEGYQKVPLNAAEGYIMSRVDGRSSAGEICAVSPMGEETTLRALYGLALAGILDMPQEPASSAAAARPGASPGGAQHPPGVPAARVPSNGGAASSPGNRAARPGSVTPFRQAARTPPARRPAPVPAKTRPATSAELEAEMLQRFSQMHDQDLYQVLGIATTAQTDEIRRAYYGFAKKFHPDKFTDDAMKAKAEKVFAHITEAYSTLSNVDARQKYDQDQATRKSGQSVEKKVDSGEMARMNFKHGKEMFDKGRVGEAIPFLQNACDQDPGKAEYFHILAVAQSRNPRWKKDAEENFLKAIERDATNAEMYAQLGALYAKGGLHTKARDMFKKALQWDPANVEAQEGLAPQEGGKKGILGIFKK